MIPTTAVAALIHAHDDLPGGIEIIRRARAVQQHGAEQPARGELPYMDRNLHSRIMS